MADTDIAIRLSLKDGETVRRALMQLGDDGQKALAKIEKQAKPASKGLLAVNAAAGELKSGAAASAQRLGAVGVGLTAMGPAGLAAAAGIGAVVVAIGQLIAGARQSVDAIDEINKMAQQAGQTVEAYQELSFAAIRYGVNQDALVDGLKELALRADEFARTGKGPAADAFRLIGMGQRDVQNGLKDLDKLFMGVIRRIESMNDTAAEIRLADELFGGTGGEQFVRLINAGADAIARARHEAYDFGAVLDGELVRGASEAKMKLAEMAYVTDANLNAALLNMGPILVYLTGLWRDFWRLVNWGLNGFSKQDTLGKLKEELLAVNQEVANLISKKYNATSNAQEYVYGEDLKKKQAEAARIYAEIDRLTKENNDRFNNTPKPTAGNPPTPITAPQGSAPTMEQIQAGLDQIVTRQKAFLDSVTRENLRASSERIALVEHEKQAQLAQIDELQLGSTRAAQVRAQVEATAAAKIAQIREDEAAKAKAAADKIAKAEEQRLRSSTFAADGIKRAFIDIRDASTNMAQQWEDDVKGMNATGRASFIAMATQARETADIIANVFNDLQERLAGRLYDKTVGTIFDGFLDKMFPANHAGGMVSQPTFQRRVSPLAWMGAERKHGGGYPGLHQGERPIIALNTERLLTMAQQDNTAKTIASLAAMTGGGGDVNIVVHNNAGRVAQATAQTRRGAGGGLEIDVFVEEIESRLGQNIARGQGDVVNVLESRYRLDPAAGARR